MPPHWEILRRSSLAAVGASLLLQAGCRSGSADASPPVAVAAAPAPTPAMTAPTPGGGVAATASVIVQAGDSIGVGMGAGNYAAIDHLGLVPGVAIYNVSVSGQWMVTSYGNRATTLFPFADPAHSSVLVIQDGTNDLAGGTKGSALYAGTLTLFIAAAHAAGFWVVVDTILPRADAGWTAALEQQRIAYNALVRANGAGADSVNDIAADPVIGDGGNPAGSPYYADGLHPTLAGQQRLATLDAAVLAPLLARPVRP